LTAELVQLYKFRRSIPAAHQGSLDTRLRWLWHQRFGTVQMVYNESKDILDKTAATLILQAVMASDLESINQLFQRLEGGPLADDTLLDQESLKI
jgi:hypothetical protein